MKKIFSLSVIVVLSAFVASLFALAVCVTFNSYFVVTVGGTLILCLLFGVFD